MTINNITLDRAANSAPGAPNGRLRRRRHAAGRLCPGGHARAHVRTLWRRPCRPLRLSPPRPAVTLRYQQHWSKESDAHYEGMKWLFSSFAAKYPNITTRGRPDPRQHGDAHEDPGRLRGRRLPRDHPRGLAGIFGTPAI